MDEIPYDELIIPNAPILALLGDIGLTFTQVLKDFLHYQASAYKLIS